MHNQVCTMHRRSELHSNSPWSNCCIEQIRLDYCCPWFPELHGVPLLCIGYQRHEEEKAPIANPWTRLMGAPQPSNAMIIPIEPPTTRTAFFTRLRCPVVEPPRHTNQWQGVACAELLPIGESSCQQIHKLLWSVYTSGKGNERTRNEEAP